MKKILVVTEDNNIRKIFSEHLGHEFFIQFSHGYENTLDVFNTQRHELLFLDAAQLMFKNSTKTVTDIKKMLDPFLTTSPVVQIVMMSGKENIRLLVDAVQAGASDYLTFPLYPEEVELAVRSIRKAVRMKSELEYLRDEFWRQESLHYVQTRNAIMQKVFEKIKSVAQTRATVLLTGETGTGKGLIAKLIHLHSNRRNKQFIQVHCGAIPESLIESELFGHEKGAFTGAIRKRLGKFEIAHEGTIFLDEIGTVTPIVQIKLLQVLQERTLCRVGGEHTFEIDSRIIAATNDDLPQLISTGMFRADLFYRLNVFPIELPPLRNRLEDIPELLTDCLEELNKIHGKEIDGIDPQVISALKSYNWPGNIREFENIIERAYILENSNILQAENLPEDLLSGFRDKKSQPPRSDLSLKEIRNRAIQTAEIEYLNNLLASHKGRIGTSAQTAGISVRQLHKLLTKYKISKNKFKG